jgi:tRNA dimethylallyltransferase
MRPDFWNHPLHPICLAGPTASGKSGLAAALAAKLGAEIINVDAYQIYQGLPILTAQPSAREFESATHHLYGVLPLTEICNAGHYFRLASAKIQQLQTSGIRPLLVGGNGMYFKCLTHGLNELPEADLALRAKLEVLSPQEIANQLLALDAAAASHVNLQNPRHALRALEICLLTGRPSSELKSAWQAEDWPVPGVFLHPNRAALYARINLRTREMLQQGAIEEVAALDELSRTAAKAIGVAEIQALLQGEQTRAETEELIAQATRRYAKRQISWFRNQMKLVEVPEPTEFTLLQILQQLTQGAAA